MSTQPDKQLRDEMLYHRATQTYLWALPLINTLGMQRGSERAFGEGYNVLPVWKRRLDAKTLVTTPNSDVIYAMSYVDLGKDGPLVFDAPPMLQGILLDFWQRPIPVDGGKYAGDVGFFGPDQGKGGKFLLLPPGYEGEVPEGYFVCRSGTNNVFVFLRAFYADASNLKPPVDLIEKTKIYPLKGEAKPMKFPDASGVPVNMLPIERRDGLRRTEEAGGHRRAAPGRPGLDGHAGRTRHREGGAVSAGRTHAGHPRPRGEVGVPDEPRDRSGIVAFDEVVSGRSFRMYPDRRWVNPMADATAEKPSGKLDLSWRRVDRGGALDVDCRPWFFSNYYSISPGMLSQIPGKGAFYVIAFTDGDGVPLAGGTNYKLNMPKDVPAANFWSVTLYEAENASGLANGQPFPSLGSRDKPVQNADGSTDLFLGPESPGGQGEELARHGARKRVLRHSAALRADRTGSREDLETRRRREDEVTFDPRSRRGLGFPALCASRDSLFRPRTHSGEDIMSTEKLTTPIGDFEFVLGGYPTKESAQKLFDALDFQRACQAYLDFMPAMSMYSVLEGQEKGLGCKECSDLAVAADLLDAPLPLVSDRQYRKCLFRWQRRPEERTAQRWLKSPRRFWAWPTMPISGTSSTSAWSARTRGKGANTCCCLRIMKAKCPNGYFVARSRTYRVWVMARAGQKISGMGEQAIKWYGDNCAVYPLKDGPRKANIINAEAVYRQIPSTPMISSTLSISTR